MPRTVRRLVARSEGMSVLSKRFLKGGKLHFHAPIGAIILVCSHKDLIFPGRCKTCGEYEASIDLVNRHEKSCKQATTTCELCGQVGIF